MAEVKQEVRKIKVFRTKDGSLNEIESDASFIGEILKKVNIDLSKENVMIKETRNTLTDERAELPTGEFLLFVSPKKAKSGGSTPDYASMKFPDLRALAKERLTKVPSKKEDIIAELKKLDRNANKEVLKKDAKVAKAEAASKILTEGEVIFDGESAQQLRFIASSVIAIADGLNLLLVEGGYEPIQLGDNMPLRSLPTDQKAYSEFTPEELEAKRLKDIADAKKIEKENLQKEAATLSFD